MALIYITGMAGAGKSTIRQALQARGYMAYDIDEDNFKSWYHRSTNVRALEQKEWQEVPAAWRKSYWLKAERAKVEKLAAAAKKQVKPIFLCGTAPNDNDIWDIFDVVIHLRVSNETLQRRLASRTNNDYGTQPDDLQDILRWNETAAEHHAKQGAIMVDAEQPVTKVLTKILENVHNSPSTNRPL